MEHEEGKAETPEVVETVPVTVGPTVSFRELANEISISTDQDGGVRPYAQKLTNCWRCEFMNRVKQEEDPGPFGFSHTRLGMERAHEKSVQR